MNRGKFSCIASTYILLGQRFLEIAQAANYKNDLRYEGHQSLGNYVGKKLKVLDALIEPCGKEFSYVMPTQEMTTK